MPVARGVKYTWESPDALAELSTTTPLAPPATAVVAAVAVLAEMAAPLVTSNDIRHPEAPGQLIGEVVTALACVFRKIQSFAPPVAFGLSNSTTGEQVAVAEATLGPVVTVDRAPTEDTATW